MAEAVYLVCALTSASCAVLLGRGYRRTRTRLLLWSALSFSGLALNNVLLFVDLVMVPGVDLALWRNGVALVSLMLLLIALLREWR